MTQVEQSETKRGQNNRLFYSRPVKSDLTRKWHGANQWDMTHRAATTDKNSKDSSHTLVSFGCRDEANWFQMGHGLQVFVSTLGANLRIAPRQVSHFWLLLKASDNEHRTTNQYANLGKPFIQAS